MAKEQPICRQPQTLFEIYCERAEAGGPGRTVAESVAICKERFGDSPTEKTVAAWCARNHWKRKRAKRWEEKASVLAKEPAPDYEVIDSEKMQLTKELRSIASLAASALKAVLRPQEGFAPNAHALMVLNNAKNIHSLVDTLISSGQAIDELEASASEREAKANAATVQENEAESDDHLAQAKAVFARMAKNAPKPAGGQKPAVQ